MIIHQPLELEYWFVNVFSGNWEIFSFISILVISNLCALFRMPVSAFLIMLVSFGAILYSAGDNTLLVLLILILAPIFFWITRKIVD